MKVNFVSKLTEKNEILALVTDKKSLSEFKELDKNFLNKINHAVNNENFEFNKFSSLEIINDKNNSFSKIIIISPGQKSLISGNDLAIIGGKINQISSKYIELLSYFLTTNCKTSLRVVWSFESILFL